MAFAPHSLLTFGGGIGSGADAETWQCGVRLAQLQGSSNVQLDDLTGYLSAVQGGLASAWGAPTGLSSASVGAPNAFAQLLWAKVANIGADGKYSGVTDNHGGPNPASTTFTTNGVSTAGNLPTFLTLAVSFHTASPTRWARHGRIYAPLALASAVSGSPRATTTAINNAVTWIKLLLTNIAKPVSTGANTGAIRPVVASKHAGELFQITEVRVGDVIDVQRRRKKSLHENYTKSAWS